MWPYFTNMYRKLYLYVSRAHLKTNICIRSFAYRLAAVNSMPEIRFRGTLLKFCIVNIYLCSDSEFNLVSRWAPTPGSKLMSEFNLTLVCEWWASFKKKNTSGFRHTPTLLHSPLRQCSISAWLHIMCEKYTFFYIHKKKNRLQQIFFESKKHIIYITSLFDYQTFWCEKKESGWKLYLYFWCNLPSKQKNVNIYLTCEY